MMEQVKHKHLPTLPYPNPDPDGPGRSYDKAPIGEKLAVMLTEADDLMVWYGLQEKPGPTEVPLPRALLSLVEDAAEADGDTVHGHGLHCCAVIALELFVDGSRRPPGEDLADLHQEWIKALWWRWDETSTMMLSLMMEAARSGMPRYWAAAAAAAMYYDNNVRPEPGE